MMDGRAFLAVAEDNAAGPSEAYWRSAVVNAYYALMLEGRDALLRWGFSIPPRQGVHAWVRLTLTYAAAPDLKEIAYALDELVQLRNKAHYNLKPLSEIASATDTQNAVQRARDALAFLDGIEADPARRAAAIASIPP
jgi:hypothetical protein